MRIYKPTVLGGDFELRPQKVAVWFEEVYTMPRRTKNTRKKEPVAPSAVSKEKIVTIAEDAAVDSFLDDFSVQSEGQRV